MSISPARCAEINARATAYFEQALHDAPEAQALIDARRLAPDVVTRYRLGYAPDAPNLLYLHLSASGYTDAELVDAGLVRESDDGQLFDVFRNKVMFPVLDTDGARVLGFSSRRIRDEDGPKYVNTASTVLFRKNQIFYGLPQTSAIARAGEAFIVEGNFDLLALLSHRFEPVVAVLGTALTEEHFFRLRAIRDRDGHPIRRITLVLDADSAGQKATLKSLTNRGSRGLDVGVVTLSGGKDADELLRSDPSAWERLLAGREGRWDYLWRSVRAQFPEDLDIEGTVAWKDAWCETVLAAGHTRAERMDGFARIARALDLDPSLFEREYLPVVDLPEASRPDELILLSIARQWDSIGPFLPYIELNGAVSDALAAWRAAGVPSLTPRQEHEVVTRGGEIDAAWDAFFVARLRPRLQAILGERLRSVLSAPPSEQARLRREIEDIQRLIASSMRQQVDPRYG